jgi:hypothetical protein
MESTAYKITLWGVTKADIIGKFIDLNVFIIQKRVIRKQKVEVIL